MNSTDILIAGAGIIGVSLALELRERGAEVLVLDRAEPGREASSAAAGMLAAGDHETPAGLRDFAEMSANLYPSFVERIEGLSGINVDFRRHGNIVLMTDATPLPGHRPLSAQELKDMEPALVSQDLFPFFIEGNTVDPVSLMRAALATCARQGIEVRRHTEVMEIRETRSRVEVVTDSEVLTTRLAVNCRGSWAGQSVRPRKGQLLSLMPDDQQLLTHVLQAPEVYVVPRTNGRIVLGATVEDVGFDKKIVPEAVEGLRKAAVRYIPALASAPVLETWAGLRPGTPDNLPLLGVTNSPRIFIASGHFRNGILLAPATAKVMADLIEGKTPAIDVANFAPGRFVTAGR